MPPFPEYYIPEGAAAVINPYLERAQKAHAARAALPDFPEADVVPFLRNTWAKGARAVFENWLGLVARLTGPDRRVQFKDGIDPDKPLDGLMRG